MRRKAIRKYFHKCYRIRRNRGLMRGGYVLELGYWVPSGFLRYRDKFNVIRPVRGNPRVKP
jgi:hypothetical protein